MRARPGARATVALACLCASVAGCVRVAAPPETRLPAPLSAPDWRADAAPRPEAAAAIAETPPAPGLARSRLSGDWVAEQRARRRILAVMVDNQGRARPQSGLEQASVVVEVLEEGGITRYLALFLEGDTAKVGPVRSTRPYFIDILHDFDGVLVHCGQSKHAFHKIVAEHTAVINEMWTREAFWRSNRKRQPHNLYASTLTCREIVREKGWDVSRPQVLYAFVSATPTPPAPHAPGDRAALSFRYILDNQVSYKWDPQTNRYRRYLNGQPHKDANSGRQLTCANVVVQYVEDQVIDRKLRLDVKLVGEGELLLFRDGIVVQGRWRKPARYEPTRYFGPDGATLALNPGPTWIQLLPPGRQVAYTVRPAERTPAKRPRPEDAPADAGPGAAERTGRPLPRWESHTASLVSVSAEPTAPTAPAAGRLAVIIDDLGYSRTPYRLLSRVQAPLTWSIFPSMPATRFFGEKAREHGLCAMVHLPLQNKAYTPRQVQRFLLVSMPEAEADALLTEHLDSLPQASGINNHSGDLGTEDFRLMRLVMRKLSARGLFFVDSVTSPRSVCRTVADELGVPFAARNVFLDDPHESRGKPRKPYIAGQLREAARLARTLGSAIAIGHPHASTLEVLAAELPRIAADGVAIVPASELVVSAGAR